MCQPLRSTAHKPASAQKWGLPVPCHACQGNREADRASKGDICEREGGGGGGGDQLQGLSLVWLLKKKTKNNPAHKIISAGCQGKCHRGNIKEPQMTL